MKKITLAGASLNSGNRGVNALTRSMIMLILNRYGEDTEINILSYSVNGIVDNKIFFNNKEIIVKEELCTRKSMMMTYFLAFFKIDTALSKKISYADEIWDISEGDSFSDIYGLGRLFQHSFIKLITIKRGKKLVLMPQTMGPFKSWIAKFIAKRIIKKADKVFVRDEISKNILKDKLKINREINYSPDMAFYMNPSKDIDISKFIKDFSKIKVGINISALMYNGGYSGKNMFNLKIDYKRLINSIIELLSKKENLEIILIPHVMCEDLEVEDDFRTCEDISKEFMSKKGIKIKTLDKYYREDEIKSIISGCDFFIGSRMHACIGAISTIVPTVPIAYSRKFIGIWEKIGLGDCVADPRVQNEEEIIGLIEEKFSTRVEIKDKLEKEIPILKEKIDNMIMYI